MPLHREVAAGLDPHLRVHQLRYVAALKSSVPGAARCWSRRPAGPGRPPLWRAASVLLEFPDDHQARMQAHPHSQHPARGQRLQGRMLTQALVTSAPPALPAGVVLLRHRRAKHHREAFTP